jgi:hypothetical protein
LRLRDFFLDFARLRFQPRRFGFVRGLLFRSRFEVAARLLLFVGGRLRVAFEATRFALSLFDFALAARRLAASLAARFLLGPQTILRRFDLRRAFFQLRFRLRHTLIERRHALFGFV